MAKLLNEGDRVEVTFSNSGYTGAGELISIAYGSTWLVKVDLPEKTTIITVKSQYINKLSDAAYRAKKKKDSTEAPEGEGEEDEFSQMTPRERKRMEKQIKKEKKKQAMMKAKKS